MASANLGTAYIKVAPNMSGVQGKVLAGFKGLGNQVTDQIGDEAGKGSSKFTAGMAALWGVATAIATKAIDSMMASLDAGIKRFDTMNNFPNVMKNLGIAASDSEKVIAKLADKLQGLPTTLDSAAGSVQRLTSKNGDIYKSTEYFLALNNAILAGGASTDIQASAIEQLSQAYAKGKPDMMEWRSIMTAMPAQLKQVAIAMGYIDADALGEDLRKGNVSMEAFMDTLVRLNSEGVGQFASFEQQARSATGGIQTGLTNVSTAWARMWTKMLDAVGSEAINGMIQNTISRINWLGDALVGGIKWVQTYSEQLKILGSVVGGVAAAFVAANLYNTISNISFAVSQSGRTLSGFNAIMTQMGGRYAAFSKGISGMGGAFKGLFGVLKAHPVIAIIAAIAGALAIFFTQTETGRKLFEQIKTVVMDVLGKAFEALKPAIEAVSAVFAKFGEVIKNVFSKIGPAISSTLEKIGPTLAKVGETFGKVFSKIAQVAAKLFDALGPVFEQIGQAIVDMLPSLQPLMESFSGLGEALSNAFSTIGPAIGELGVTVGELFKTIGPMLAELGKSVMDIFKKLAPVIGNLAKTFGELFKKLVPVIAQIIKLAIEVVGKLLPPLMELLGSILPPIMAVIGLIIGVIVELLKAVLPPLISIITSLVQVLTPIISLIADVLVVVINNVLIPAITAIINVVTAVINAVVPIIENAIKFITSIIQFFVDLFSGNFDKLGEDIKNIWNSLWSYVGSILQGAWNLIKSIFQNIWNFITSIFSGLWNAVTGFLSTFVNNVVNFFKGIPDKIWEAIKGIGEVGKNLVEGLWNGISDMVGWIGEKIKGFGEGILNGIKSFFGIASPSKVMAKMGGYIGEGLAVGLEKSTDLVTNAMDDMLEEATSGITAIDTALAEGMNANLSTAAQLAMGDNTQPAKVAVQVDAQINEQMDLNKVASDIGYAVAMA